jgi:hypothetical protein
MIVETLSALGAISLGASLGVFIVASEATLDSLKPWKQRAPWGSGRESVSVVVGGVPWRASRAGMPEAFCGVCDESLAGAPTDEAGASDAHAALRCPPCGLAYPLTEGMTWHEVVMRAEMRLSAAAARMSPSN